MLLLVAAAGAGAAVPRGVSPPPRCCRRVHRRHRRQRGITDARARQIQTALVKAGYLHHVSGHWDRATHRAMVRYQRDHHWQTRWVPDSRALIALGVGPKRDEATRRPAAPVPAKRAAAGNAAAKHAAHPNPAPAAAHPTGSHSGHGHSRPL